MFYFVRIFLHHQLNIPSIGLETKNKPHPILLNWIIFLANERFNIEMSEISNIYFDIYCIPRDRLIEMLFIFWGKRYRMHFTELDMKYEACSAAFFTQWQNPILYMHILQFDYVMKNGLAYLCYFCYLNCVCANCAYVFSDLSLDLQFKWNLITIRCNLPKLFTLLLRYWNVICQLLARL